jgi:hypothetical protein
MKTVGFIDYFLHEWHANEYPAMIAAYNEKNGTDYQVKYAWAEIDSPNKGARATEEWCKDYGVERCETIEELCEKCDYVFVLAPSNPEKHFDYAKKVFACGKTPYIDKTFAPDFATAKAIYAEAEKCGVKFFSSSALRYSEELNAYMGTANAIFTTGGGSNFEEYVIHQIEMIVKCLGVGAKKVCYYKNAAQEWVDIAYADGRSARLMFARCMPFVATVSDESGTKYLPINSAFFEYLIADIFRFFETGELPFCPSQTLEVMKIREAVIIAKDKMGDWIALSDLDK